MKALLTTITSSNYCMQLALYYLKAYCMKHCFKNGIQIDIRVFPEDKKIGLVIEEISNYNADIIGFSCYVWNIKNILKIAKNIKNRNKNTLLILGGPEVSPRARSILKYYKFVDIVVIGEGEATFKEIVDNFNEGRRNFENINGLCLRQENKVIVTPRREEIPDIDVIPSPYLEGIIDIGKSNGFVHTETLRGCLFRCRYCYYHKEFSGMRYFSLKRVEKELAYILKKGPSGVYLMDPTFNFNKERAKKILRIFIRHNQKSNLHVELKAEFLDKEMVSLLSKAKTNFIEIGIQSTNPKTLRAINRHFEPYSFRRGISMLNKKKIPYEIQLIDCLPEENYKTFKSGINWLMSLRCKKINIMRFMLIPGTYLRQRGKDFGLRFNHQPPYRIYESKTFSTRDLKNTQILERAMHLLYDSGLLRNSIYSVEEDLKIGFTKIFELWHEWMEKNYNQLLNFRYSKQYKNSRKAVSLLAKARDIKIIEKIEPFLEYIYKRYAKTNALKDALRVFRQDKKASLAKIGARICKQLN